MVMFRNSLHAGMPPLVYHSHCFALTLVMRHGGQFENVPKARYTYGSVKNGRMSMEEHINDALDSVEDSTYCVASESEDDDIIFIENVDDISANDGEHVEEIPLNDNEHVVETFSNDHPVVENLKKNNESEIASDRDSQSSEADVKYIDDFKTDLGRKVKPWIKRVVKDIGVNVSKPQAYGTKQRDLIEGTSNFQYNKLWDCRILVEHIEQVGNYMLLKCDNVHGEVSTFNGGQYNKNGDSLAYLPSCMQCNVLGKVGSNLIFWTHTYKKVYAFTILGVNGEMLWDKSVKAIKGQKNGREARDATRQRPLARFNDHQQTAIVR
ncbi:60 kDa chaperonin [Striga asiatica]|uniref:60 kDa chaperonin n=1 Tax=Striga asiatica TaxID=4170 RepID=A0A5A7Q9T4_STRAF|nr:60 kDa chaperonin [Striga asiatica]